MRLRTESAPDPRVLANELNVARSDLTAANARIASMLNAIRHANRYVAMCDGILAGNRDMQLDELRRALITAALEGGNDEP